MLKSVIVILILAISAMVAENFFAGGKIWHKRRDGTHGFVFMRSVKHYVDQKGWVRIWVPAIAVGVVGYLTAIFSATWFAWVALLAFIGIGIYYACWYYRDGDRLRELIPFWPILYIIGNQIKQVGNVIVPTLKSDIAAVIFVKILPEFALFVFGVLLVICLWRKWQKSENELYKWIAIILAILLAIGSITVCLNAFQSLKKTNVATTQTAAKASTWYHFYNTDLQYDGNDDNNYNFGPSPYNANYVAKDYDQDFRTRLESDPALGAADLAWFDANMGTRFLGEFYDSCKGDWAKTMNAAKATWLKDQKLYKKTLTAFFTFLDTGKVEIADNGKGITDQMYMNPYTVDTIPDIIVMKTTQQDGPFLVYNFNIKGNIKTVKYRIPCGYQPTNVAKIMSITPQQNSTPKKTTTSSKSTTSSKPTPSSSKPTPSSSTPSSSTPSNPKDPSKSNNTGKNDDPGPGENTNTGVGSNKSSKEKPSNSNNLPNYSKYKEEIKELEETNKTASKIETSSNAPTTSTPANTKVDNPGKTEVDKPAPSSPQVTEIKGDQNAQAWDGPAD